MHLFWLLQFSVVNMQLNHSWLIFAEKIKKKKIRLSRLNCTTDTVECQSGDAALTLFNLIVFEVSKNVQFGFQSWNKNWRIIKYFFCFVNHCHFSPLFGVLPTNCIFEIVETRVKVNLHLHIGSVQECPSCFFAFVYLGKISKIEIRSLSTYVSIVIYTNRTYSM